MPPRLRQITIEGFRSVNDQIVINFPVNQPVVLIGENNSGKSNIIRAIELMFGEFHPKYKKNGITKKKHDALTACIW